MNEKDLKSTKTDNPETSRRDFLKTGTGTVAIGFFLATSSGLFAASHEKSTAANLEGSEWLAVEVDGTDAADETNSTIRFREAGKAEGNSGCKSYTANMSLDGTNLSLSQIATTTRMCDMRYEQAEKAFIAALEKVGTFSINYNVLRFSDADGNEVIKFRRLGTTF
jgi:heat shock protein HslJ